MHLTDILKDPATPDERALEQHTRLLDRAAELDIEVTGMSHEWFLPQGCKQRTGHAMPARDLTPGSSHLQQGKSRPAQPLKQCADPPSRHSRSPCPSSHKKENACPQTDVYSYRIPGDYSVRLFLRIAASRLMSPFSIRFSRALMIRSFLSRKPGPVRFVPMV